MQTTNELKAMSIQNLNIRQETAQDYLEVAKVNNLAFKQNNEAKLIEKIRKSDRYIAKLSLVAELNNKIIGHIMFSYIDLVNKDTIKVLALAPVAVLPVYQNKGVGSSLVDTGLTIAEKTSAPMVIVLGHSQFYSRFGFIPSTAYNIKSPFDVPESAFMIKTHNNYYEEMKGKVVYSKAFSDV